MKIWVDDIRTPPDDYTWWAGTSAQAISMLKICRAMGHTINVLSLDHDLGGEDTTRPIVLWMCENDFWPVEIRVHTSNPPGRDWLEGMIERYKPNE